MMKSLENRRQNSDYLSALPNIPAEDVITGKETTKYQSLGRKPVFDHTKPCRSCH